MTLSDESASVERSILKALVLAEDGGATGAHAANMAIAGSALLLAREVRALAAQVDRLLGTGS